MVPGTRFVTYMELLQGMRNKQETAKMKKAFKAMDVGIIPINENASLQAAQYVEDYALSDSMELAESSQAFYKLQRW